MSEWRDTHQWAETHRRRELLNLRAEMTLGEAIEELDAPPILCACLGGPHCCALRGIVATDLRRGAHIAAKLFTDAAHRPGYREE